MLFLRLVGSFLKRPDRTYFQKVHVLYRAFRYWAFLYWRIATLLLKLYFLILVVERLLDLRNLLYWAFWTWVYHIRDDD